MWTDMTSDSNGEVNTPLLDIQQEPKFTGRYSSPEFWNPPSERWLFIFPESMEKTFEGFDNAVIKFVQKYNNKFLTYFDLIVTAFVAIETGIAAPFVLFILGIDGLATELSYLMLLLALFSQIPKRFIWRFRPYMANRALKARQAETAVTSSFPSRAVTCAVVYSYVIIYIIMYFSKKRPFQVDWWMPFFVIGMAIVASFGRINLGVHYPTDCVAGFLQGVIVCLLGTLIWKADTLGCSSCWDESCYQINPAHAMTKHSFLTHLNLLVFILCIISSIIITFVSVVKPISFWEKCDRVYGMLLPGIVFQLTFLCPKVSRASLPPPIHPPPWYAYLYALAFVGTVTAATYKNKGKYPVLSFIVCFIVNFCALVFFRLWLL